MSVVVPPLRPHRAPPEDRRRRRRSTLHRNGAETERGGTPLHQHNTTRYLPTPRDHARDRATDTHVRYARCPSASCAALARTRLRLHALACTCMRLHALACTCMCLHALACACMRLHALARACMRLLHALAYMCAALAPRPRAGEYGRLGTGFTTDLLIPEVSEVERGGRRQCGGRARTDRTAPL